MSSTKHHRNQLLLAAATLCVITGTPCSAQPSLSVSPTVVVPGSEIVVTVNPATVGYELHPGIEVSWQGVYRDPSGTETAVFSVEFALADKHILSQTEVALPFGAGSFANLPAFWMVQGFEPGGQFIGQLTIASTPTIPCFPDWTSDGILDNGDVLAFLQDVDTGDSSAFLTPPSPYPGGPPRVRDLEIYMSFFEQGCSSATFTISDDMNLSMPSDNTRWQKIIYPSGYSFGVPTLGDESETPFVYHLKQHEETPWDPINGSLLEEIDFHYCLVIPVPKNRFTEDAIVASLPVSVATFDAQGMFVDAIDGLTVYLDTSLGDSEYVYYRTSLLTPILFVEEEPLPRAGYTFGAPNARAPALLVKAAAGGHVVVSLQWD